ncbi:TPA: Rap1a/Tai family immunity protein [Vibrio cholerae]
MVSVVVFEFGAMRCQPLRRALVFIGVQVKILLLIITLIFSSVSHSAFFSGNDILALCEAKKEDKFYFEDSAQCYGYVTGVYDHFTGTIKEGVLCLNEKITVGQVVKIFVAYANKNPAKLNQSADIVVENSIYDAFKCNQKN